MGLFLHFCAGSDTITNLFQSGGSPGLVVMGDDSCSKKVIGSNPGAVHWMDIFSHRFCCKNCIVCLKRQKINEKEDRVGPIKKTRFSFLTLRKSRFPPKNIL